MLSGVCCAVPWWQVAAAVGGRILSVFDGETEYELGRWTLTKHGAASWPPVHACFYCFPTIHDVSGWGTGMDSTGSSGSALVAAVGVREQVRLYLRGSSRRQGHCMHAYERPCCLGAWLSSPVQEWGGSSC